MAKTHKIGNAEAVDLLDMARQVVDQSGDWRAVADDLVEALADIAADTEEPERVIFRKFPHDGAVIALFPDQYSERTGMIGSYMELGQHADTIPVFGDTVAANPAEYRDLMNELIRQGYHNLKVVKRFGKLGK